MSPSPLFLARRSIFRSSPPVPPSPSGPLSWAPPGYPSYTNYEYRDITNAARDHIGTFGGGRNCVFTIREKITSGSILIQGWNNVVLIGGEVDAQSGGFALRLYGIDGTAHIEGLKLGGPGVWDVIGLSMGRTYASGLPGGTFQIQNCYLRNNTDSNVQSGAGHADAVQIWSPWNEAAGGVGGCGPVHADRVTAYSWRQAFFWGNHDGALGNLDLRNCDLHQVLSPTITWGGHVLMKTYRNDKYGRPSHMTLSNIYVQGHPGMSNRDWVVPDDQGGYDGAYTEASRANHLGSDADGQYLYWDATADVSGIVRLGNRPEGEYCPAASVGMGYVSPGYV